MSGRKLVLLIMPLVFFLIILYILTLDEKASISVIDPMLGLYISRLFTDILLKSPGEDWALTRGGKRLYVAIPKANQVAVVKTGTRKVIANVEAGRSPVCITSFSDALL